MLGQIYTESFYGDPLFFIHFWVTYMHIFYSVKGQ